jgi:hypothetical protein
MKWFIPVGRQPIGECLVALCTSKQQWDYGTYAKNGKIVDKFHVSNSSS